MKSNNKKAFERFSVDDSCIIIFTRDRPRILSKCIKQINRVGIDIIILDDSEHQETKEMFAEDLIGDNIFYHGKYDQKGLLQELSSSDINSFLSPLGSKGWNLGFTRNYAIVLSKVLGYKKVLFMDDDIIVKDVDIIHNMMTRLDTSDFVGAKIIGMPDDSLVGHLMRMCGGEVYEFLSGGFLAFNLDVVSEYFLNHYNEDYIWLYLHSLTAKIEMYGEVEQLPFNPFEQATRKALKQEFGEILVEGAEEAAERKDFALLTKKAFWNEILSIRANYISGLQNLGKGTKVEGVAMAVHDALTNYYSNIYSSAFVNVFSTYFETRSVWKHTLKRANSISSLDGSESYPSHTILLPM